MDPKGHWEEVYRTKLPTEVSWYRPHLETSLQLIEDAAPDRGSRIVDVGGGESTLVDDLLARGYGNLAVLDLSATALAVAQRRLGDRGRGVEWLCGDVTDFDFAGRRCDVWHDRAVFHFLTRPDDRRAYVRQVERVLEPGGHVIVATFGPQGPTQCSGLDVVRYDADALRDAFGPGFARVKSLTELHRTPSGAIQAFTYCYCRVGRVPC